MKEHSRCGQESINDIPIDVGLALRSRSLGRAVAGTVENLRQLTGRDHGPDLWQQVRCVLLEEHGRLKFALVDNPVDYLARVGRNQAVSYWRREKLRVTDAEREEPPDTSWGTPEEIWYAHRQWYGRLPAPQERACRWVISGEGEPPYAPRHLRRLMQEVRKSYESCIEEPCSVRGWSRGPRQQTRMPGGGKAHD